MGIGKKILEGITGKSLRDGLALIDEVVVDKDLANKLKAELYIAELQTKTIPVVDAIHKMGRQLLAIGQIGFYAWALKNGYEIDWELVAGVSGATGIYTAVKGKGK